MPTDFTLPELGENVAGGDVVRVLVAPGDTVKKDQPVLELETDKATIEVPSSVAGVVKDVRVKQGERITVGQVVLTVDSSDAAAAPQGKAAPADAPKPQPAGAPEEGGLSQQAPSVPMMSSHCSMRGDKSFCPRATRQTTSAITVPPTWLANDTGRRVSGSTNTLTTTGATRNINAMRKTTLANSPIRS